MKGFWANEWDLFLKDMQELGEFFLQPVEITMPGKNKASNGFWANEWELFKDDLKNAKEFFTQPVEFK